MDSQPLDRQGNPRTEEPLDRSFSVSLEATLEQTEGGLEGLAPGLQLPADPGLQAPCPRCGTVSLAEAPWQPRVNAGTGLSISLTHSSCSASFCEWPSALHLQAVFLGPVFAASFPDPFLLFVL